MQLQWDDEAQTRGDNRMQPGIGFRNLFLKVVLRSLTHTLTPSHKNNPHTPVWQIYLAEIEFWAYPDRAEVAVRSAAASHPFNATSIISSTFIIIKSMFASVVRVEWWFLFKSIYIKNIFYLNLSPALTEYFNRQTIQFNWFNNLSINLLS